MERRSAIERVNSWVHAVLPLSGLSSRRKLSVRLAGAPRCWIVSAKEIGGGWCRWQTVWRSIRDQTAPFSRRRASCGVRALRPAQQLKVGGEQLIEWGGALRWIATDLDARTLRAEVEAHGGHSLLFRSSRADAASLRPALSPALAKLHIELKRVFDPHAVLNCSPATER